MNFFFKKKTENILFFHFYSGTAAGWFLDKVIITSIKDAKAYYFLCGKWLDKGEDDGRIERDLVPADEDGVACKPIVYVLLCCVICCII